MAAVEAAEAAEAGREVARVVLERVAAAEVAGGGAVHRAVAERAERGADEAPGRADGHALLAKRMVELTRPCPRRDRSAHGRYVRTDALAAWPAGTVRVAHVAGAPAIRASEWNIPCSLTDEQPTALLFHDGAYVYAGPESPVEEELLRRARVRPVEVDAATGADVRRLYAAMASGAATLATRALDWLPFASRLVHFLLNHVVCAVAWYAAMRGGGLANSREAWGAVIVLVVLRVLRDHLDVVYDVFWPSSLSRLLAPLLRYPFFRGLHAAFGELRAFVGTRGVAAVVVALGALLTGWLGGEAPGTLSASVWAAVEPIVAAMVPEYGAVRVVVDMGRTLGGGHPFAPYQYMALACFVGSIACRFADRGGRARCRNLALLPPILQAVGRFYAVVQTYGDFGAALPGGLTRPERVLEGACEWQWKLYAAQKAGVPLRYGGPGAGAFWYADAAFGELRVLKLLSAHLSARVEGLRGQVDEYTAAQASTLFADLYTINMHFSYIFEALRGGGTDRFNAVHRAVELRYAENMERFAKHQKASAEKALDDLSARAALNLFLTDLLQGKVQPPPTMSDEHIALLPPGKRDMARLNNLAAEVDMVFRRFDKSTARTQRRVLALFLHGDRLRGQPEDVIECRKKLYYSLQWDEPANEEAIREAKLLAEELAQVRAFYATRGPSKDLRNAVLRAIRDTDATELALMAEAEKLGRSIGFAEYAYDELLKLHGRTWDDVQRVPPENADASAWGWFSPLELFGALLEYVMRVFVGRRAPADAAARPSAPPEPEGGASSTPPEPEGGPPPSAPPSAPPAEKGGASSAPVARSDAAPSGARDGVTLSRPTQPPRPQVYDSRAELGAMVERVKQRNASETLEGQQAETLEGQRAGTLEKQLKKATAFVQQMERGRTKKHERIAAQELRRAMEQVRTAKLEGGELAQALERALGEADAARDQASQLRWRLGAVEANERGLREQLAGLQLKTGDLERAAASGAQGAKDQLREHAAREGLLQGQLLDREAEAQKLRVQLDDAKGDLASLAGEAEARRALLLRYEAENQDLAQTVRDMRDARFDEAIARGDVAQLRSLVRLAPSGLQAERARAMIDATERIEGALWPDRRRSWLAWAGMAGPADPAAAQKAIDAAFAQGLVSADKRDEYAALAAKLREELALVDDQKEQRLRGEVQGLREQLDAAARRAAESASAERDAAAKAVAAGRVVDELAAKHGATLEERDAAMRREAELVAGAREARASAASVRAELRALRRSAGVAHAAADASTRAAAAADREAAAARRVAAQLATNQSATSAQLAAAERRAEEGLRQNHELLQRILALEHARDAAQRNASHAHGQLQRAEGERRAGTPRAGGAQPIGAAGSRAVEPVANGEGAPGADRAQAWSNTTVAEAAPGATAEQSSGGPKLQRQVRRREVDPNLRGVPKDALEVALAMIKKTPGRFYDEKGHFSVDRWHSAKHGLTDEEVAYKYNTWNLVTRPLRHRPGDVVASLASKFTAQQVEVRLLDAISALGGGNELAQDEQTQGATGTGGAVPREKTPSRETVDWFGAVPLMHPQLG